MKSMQWRLSHGRAILLRGQLYVLAGVLVMLCGLPSVDAVAAEIIAATDREPVALNESFTLLFSADEEPDGDPDFGPLGAEFQILRQGKSKRVEMVNGRLSRRTEWQLTTLAKHAGSLNVPPIAFGRDRSRPFTLTVLPGKASDARAANDEMLMIEVEAEPKNPYVQAQVLYTIRLLHRVALRNGQLEDPKLIDAVVQKLGEDRRYQTERTGHLYGVVERRFAIFPQKSGPLRIEPIRLEAELSAGPGSMFDEFFGRHGQVRRIESAAVALQVRPIPPAFKGKHWLPAAKLELQETWSAIPPQTDMGEPITRTLSLKAEGVTMGMAPELTEDVPAPSGLQRYPDQPALSEEQGVHGLTAVRREKMAFIPMKEGDYTVPGLAIPWWNTVEDRLEIARVPERILKAMPTPGLNAQEPAAPHPEAVVAQPPVPETASGEVPHAADTVIPANAVWFWLTWVLGIGWLSTVAAWWWRTHRKASSAALQQAPLPSDTSKSLKALKQAVNQHDPAATRQALLDWALARWPRNAPLNLEQLAVRLGGSAPSSIAELNRVLYGQPGRDWRGDELVRLVEASRGTDCMNGGKAARDGLEALYKV